MARPAAADTIAVSGYTTGCFGTGCTDFQSSAYDSDVYLTFTGVSSTAPFDVSTDAFNVDLGSFYRDARFNVPSSTFVDFVLQVLFVIPDNTDSGSAVALITGKTVGGGGPLNIDFNNDSQWIAYSNALGSGGFYFAVTNDLDVSKNGTGTILGSITGGTFTPVPANTDPPINPSDAPLAPVPEPASLVLLGGGLVGLASKLRRGNK